MNDSTFTFAELAFLAGSTPHWTELRELLSIPATGNDVVSAGLSSLLMRGLARVEVGHGEVSVRDDVRTRIDLTLRPSHVVSMVRGDASGLNVATVLAPDSGERTILVSLVQPGVFEISALQPTEDPVGQLRDLVLAIAAENASVAIGPKDRAGEYVVSHREGEWSYGQASDPWEDHAKTKDDLLVQSALAEKLGTWLGR